jgi:hypothetical protein
VKWRGRRDWGAGFLKRRMCIYGEDGFIWEEEQVYSKQKQ